MITGALKSSIDKLWTESGLLLFGSFKAHQQLRKTLIEQRRAYLAPALEDDIQRELRGLEGML